MGTCPYCSKELLIEDFFHSYKKETKKGKIKVKLGDFKGDTRQLTHAHFVSMWACPSCDAILGFTEYYM